MKQTPLRYLFSLLLAVLFFSTAGAAETEQVLLSGDTMVYEAETVEYKEIDGIPTVLKTFILPPEASPELLREKPFMRDGFLYKYDRTDKSEQEREDVKSAEETLTLNTPTNDMNDIIAAFPSSRSYNKDGYSGILTLDTKNIRLAVSQYNTVADSQLCKVTRVYSLTHNDRSEIPESVDNGYGLDLSLTDVQWTEEAPIQGSDAPSRWIATAVYSQTINTSRQVESGYRATATYRGQVSQTSVDSIKYVVRYVGTKLPVVPDLPANIPNPSIPSEEALEWSPFVVVTPILLLLFLLIFAVWHIQWHIARVYVADSGQNLLVLANRQYVKTRSPQLRLSAFQGKDVTVYTIVLSKRLAKKLLDRTILIQSSSGNRGHTVCAFAGNQYTFSVRIPKKPKRKPKPECAPTPKLTE